MSLRGDPTDEAGTPPAFRWTTFDLTGQLPADWQQAIRAVADTADFGNFPRTPTCPVKPRMWQHIYRAAGFVPSRCAQPSLARPPLPGRLPELANEACTERSPAGDDRTASC